MKMNYLAMTAVSLLSASAFAHQPLSGTYHVIDSTDCANTYELVSSDTVEVTASSDGIEISSPDVLSGPILSIPAGHSAVDECDGASFCFNGMQFFFDGSYSDDHTQFTAIQTMTDKFGNATPRNTGEVSVSIKGDILQINSTAGYQPEPVAPTSCQLEKTQ
jgi:hypothetical protein